MSKDKRADAKPAKVKPALDEAGRVYAAMVAAGRSPRVAEHFPEEYRKEIAALCDAHGKCVPAVRDKVITILRKAGEENKAVIDGADTETKE